MRTSRRTRRTFFGSIFNYLKLNTFPAALFSPSKPYQTTVANLDFPFAFLIASGVVRGGGEGESGRSSREISNFNLFVSERTSWKSSSAPALTEFDVRIDLKGMISKSMTLCTHSIGRWLVELENKTFKTPNCTSAPGGM